MTRVPSSPRSLVSFYGLVCTLKRLQAEVLDICLASGIVDDGVVVRMLCFCLRSLSTVCASNQVARLTCSSLSISVIVYCMHSESVVWSSRAMIWFTIQYSPGPPSAISHKEMPCKQTYTNMRSLALLSRVAQHAAQSAICRPTSTRLGPCSSLRTNGSTALLGTNFR